jgi:hypothetical protein
MKTSVSAGTSLQTIVSRLILLTSSVSDKTAIDKNGCVVYWEKSTGTYLRENPGGVLTASKVCK